jgi:hypothetical protein
VKVSPDCSPGSMDLLDVPLCVLIDMINCGLTLTMRDWSGYCRLLEEYFLG